MVKHLILATLCVSAPASAAGVATRPGDDLKGKSDPRQIVCRDAVAIGSRIKKARHCRTVAEWTQRESTDFRLMPAYQPSRP